MAPPERDHRSPYPPPAQSGGWPRRSLRAVAGLLMVALGALTLLGLVYIGNCPSAFCERAMFRLGLATTGLVSAVAQAFLFAGGWMLWTALKKVRSNGTDTI